MALRPRTSGKSDKDRVVTDTCRHVGRVVVVEFLDDPCDQPYRARTANSRVCKAVLQAFRAVTEHGARKANAIDDSAYPRSCQLVLQIRKDGPANNRRFPQFRLSNEAGEFEDGRTGNCR